MRQLITAGSKTEPSCEFKVPKEFETPWNTLYLWEHMWKIADELRIL